MGVRRPAPFVGRDKELEALRAAISSAREARPEIVVVRGEAGISKSRLLGEAMARYAADDVLVVWAHGVDLVGPQLAFGVVGEGVRALVGAGGQALMEELPAAATMVARAFVAPEPGRSWRPSGELTCSPVLPPSLRPSPAGILCGWPLTTCSGRTTPASSCCSTSPEWCGPDAQAAGSRRLSGRWACVRSGVLAHSKDARLT